MRVEAVDKLSGDRNPHILHEGLASVIVNPSAGGGLPEGWIEEHLDFMPAESIHRTEKSGDARDLASRAIAAGARLVIAVGGDGTIHEVVNGFAPEFGDTVLGIVPMGTGNDTVRSLGLPADPIEAIEALRSGMAQRVDVIQVTHDEKTSYAVNVATGGMGGVVNESMPSELKDRWGPLAYARAAASALPDLPVYELELRRDDEGPEAHRVVSLVVANGAYAARGVCVAPGATMDDGRLSVHVITESGATELLGLIPAIIRGEMPDRDNYRYWPCLRLQVRVSDPMSFSLDGEAVEAQDLTFQCVPEAIRVLGADPDHPADASDQGGAP